MPLCSRLPTSSRSPRPTSERPPVSLASTFRGLKSELALLARVYERVRPDELEAWPTLSSLVGRLTDPEKQGDDGHRGLICSILAIHQSVPHRVWAAILMRTFRPMLRRVFKGLLGADRQELIALLLLSFQKALASVDPYRDPRRIAMYVRQATRRTLFAALRGERDWEGVGFGEDADDQADPDGASRLLAIEWLRDTPEAAQELVGTMSEHGALLALVRQRLPALPRREQLRLYAELRRHRSRLVKDLRERLGHPRRPARLEASS